MLAGDPDAQGAAVGGEVVGECGEFGSVAAGAFHLGLELRADSDPGADLLGEHPVARDAVLGEGVELRLKFLGERRATGQPDTDSGARGVRCQGERYRSARAPRLAGGAVGGGLHAQELGRRSTLVRQPVR